MVLKSRHIKGFCLKEQGSIFPVERDHLQVGGCAMKYDMLFILDITFASQRLQFKEDL